MNRLAHQFKRIENTTQEILRKEEDLSNREQALTKNRQDAEHTIISAGKAKREYEAWIAKQKQDHAALLRELPSLRAEHKRLKREIEKGEEESWRTGPAWVYIAVLLFAFSLGGGAGYVINSWFAEPTVVHKKGQTVRTQGQTGNKAESKKEDLVTQYKEFKWKDIHEEKQKEKFDDLYGRLTEKLGILEGNEKVKLCLNCLAWGVNADPENKKNSLEESLAAVDALLGDKDANKKLLQEEEKAMKLFKNLYTVFNENRLHCGCSGSKNVNVDKPELMKSLQDYDEIGEFTSFLETCGIENKEIIVNMLKLWNPNFHTATKVKWPQAECE